MKPLGGGHLIGSNLASLQYAIQSPLLDSVAVGMQSIAEIDANAALFDGGPDAEAQLDRLHSRSRRMMVHDWCEGCGKCAERCRQGAITIVGGRSQIDPKKCVFCGYCARVCPQFCIKVV